MSDEADVAAQHEETMRQSALTVRKRIGPVFTGFCANCGQIVEYPLRWCDVDCREDWSSRERQ